MCFTTSKRRYHAVPPPRMSSAARHPLGGGVRDSAGLYLGGKIPTVMLPGRVGRGNSLNALTVVAAAVSESRPEAASACAAISSVEMEFQRKCRCGRAVRRILEFDRHPARPAESAESVAELSGSPAPPRSAHPSSRRVSVPAAPERPCRARCRENQAGNQCRALFSLTMTRLGKKGTRTICELAGDAAILPAWDKPRTTSLPPRTALAIFMRGAA